MSETNINENDEFVIDDLDLDSDKKDDLKGDDGVMINKNKLALIKKLLENNKNNNERIIELLGAFISPADEAKISVGQSVDSGFLDESGNKKGEGRIVEGVFDGENMIGPDGKQYSIPANYASKSKLVEGDILKLTITATGTFVYKQIGPIDRKRVVGILEQSSGGNFIVNTGEKKLKVLTASVTYFRGQVGDEVVVLVPKTGDCNWAAVDNIVKN